MVGSGAEPGAGGAPPAVAGARAGLGEPLPPPPPEPAEPPFVLDPEESLAELRASGW